MMKLRIRHCYWDFAFSVTKLNSHPMYWLLQWAGVRVKQSRPLWDRLSCRDFITCRCNQGGSLRLWVHEVGHLQRHVKRTYLSTAGIHHSNADVVSAGLELQIFGQGQASPHELFKYLRR